jgi:hypothetical protein
MIMVVPGSWRLPRAACPPPQPAPHHYLLAVLACGRAAHQQHAQGISVASPAAAGSRVPSSAAGKDQQTVKHLPAASCC